MLRSVLYVPASNARAIEKARILACDAVILDLEDAGAPVAKHTARQAAVAAVIAGGFRAGSVAVRVNALATEWGAADLAALAALAATRPAAIVLPKVDGSADVAAARAYLGVTPPPVWAMIETARAMLRLEDIAGAEGLGALVMGTNDLAREMGARLRPDRTSFVGLLSLTVVAARAFGLAVLDGVYNDIGDADGFARQCQQAMDLGFDGKTLIHPGQIAPCNAAFTPDADDVAAARRVVDAFGQPENHAKGAIALDGRMVERLHLEQAHKTLALAAAARNEG